MGTTFKTPTEFILRSHLNLTQNTTRTFNSWELIWEFSFPLLLSFTFCTYMFFFSYIIHIFVQWYKALLNLNLMQANYCKNVIVTDQCQSQIRVAVPKALTIELGQGWWQGIRNQKCRLKQLLRNSTVD